MFGQSRTSSTARATSLIAGSLLVFTPGSARPAARDWPPFLPASEAYPRQIALAITRLWTEPTFVRDVRATPARVAAPLYLRFVDAPDLTALAARHLGLARYEVEALGDDWYEADDHDGAHGVYRVLLRDGGRRVIISWGSHRGAILGAVAGTALTRLDFSADGGGRTTQRIAVRVIIDNAAAAALTRLMLPMFGWLVDRKLTEGFRTTARVALWAHEHPNEFCTWWRGVMSAERRSELAAAFEECSPPVTIAPGPPGPRSDAPSSAPPDVGRPP